jgi:hypothetical protein
VCSRTVAQEESEPLVQTLFWEAKYTKAESHTGSYLSDDVARVIEELPQKEKVVGLCTDNTAANKTMWDLLERTYPKMYCYGCVCHTLHLLCKDIVQSIKWLSDLEEVSGAIVKFFKKSSIRTAELAACADAHFRRLHLPGATRWGSLLQCWRSLKRNYNRIRTYVNAADFIQRARNENDTLRRTQMVHLFVTKDKEFQIMIDTAIAIFTEICKEIVDFQGSWEVAVLIFLLQLFAR